MKDTDYMREALAMGREALHAGEIPVGCILVKDGDMIARTRNRVEADRDVTAHAEMLALRAVPRYALKDCTLYVTLEPCPMCAGAIAMSGVRRVIYGAADPACGCCGSVYRITEDPAFPGYAQADGGVLREECEALLKEGFRQLRERPGENKPL